MDCEVRQENDELACRCGMRWSVYEQAPHCNNSRPPPSRLKEAADRYKRTRFERLAINEGLSLRRGVDGQYASERTRGAYWGFCTALDLP